MKRNIDGQHSTNINKTNKHLSPETTEHKKDHDISVIKISGRPVASASNICVGRHIIRIFVGDCTI
jgi:hypothetical protein